MRKGYFLFSRMMKISYFLILLYSTLLLTTQVNAYSLSTQYPSYSYVFNEFDVDKSYIDNNEFREFVLKNEKGLETFYKRSLQRGKDILPTMKKILIGKGVSDLFIYLSMVESGFSSSALSSKKAVGLWQFMPKTAKQYKLTVTNEYDGRKDTLSSTSAAMAYLNKLHKQFGKWYLAAMAYNCGEGCMERAIRKAGTDELTVLIDNSLKYLPEETRTYIKKILFIAMLGESRKMDFSSIGESGFTEVEVSGGTDLRNVAEILNIKYKLLQKMNKHIIKGIVSNKNRVSKILIPLEKIFSFYLKYELKNTIYKIKTDMLSHNVILGESLESIAQKYNANVDEIIQVNHLEDRYLRVDQILVVPVTHKQFNLIIEASSK